MDIASSSLTHQYRSSFIIDISSPPPILFLLLPSSFLPSPLHTPTTPPIPSTLSSSDPSSLPIPHSLISTLFSTPSLPLHSPTRPHSLLLPSSSSSKIPKADSPLPKRMRKTGKRAETRSFLTQVIVSGLVLHHPHCVVAVGQSNYFCLDGCLGWGGVGDGERCEWITRCVRRECPPPLIVTVEQIGHARLFSFTPLHLLLHHKLFHPHPPPVSLFSSGGFCSSIVYCERQGHEVRR